MPNLYKRALRKTLIDVMEELLAQSPAEQVSLYEELALARITALDVVKMYDLAHESGKMELIAAAGATLRSVLAEVADIAGKISAIESSGKDKITINHITFVVNQVCRVAYDVWGETDPDRVRQFEAAIRSDIKLPTAQGGTLLTPDQDVLDMDSLIPQSEEDEDDEELSDIH